MIIAQYQKVIKPLFPPLVHDDATRIAICIVGILLCCYLLYELGRYFNGK